MRSRTGPVIGLLHPGEMGSAVGRCLAASGRTVLWASQGRGPRTAERARSCDLHDVGTAAASVLSLLDGTPLDARLVPGDIGSASAVKMAYAAWTKGSAALLLAVRALADAEGVSDVLLAEWELSQPGLLARARGAAESAAAKGWRWTGEMDEIAATMGAAGLLPGRRGDLPRTGFGLRGRVSLMLGIAASVRPHRVRRLPRFPGPQCSMERALTRSRFGTVPSGEALQPGQQPARRSDR